VTLYQPTPLVSDPSLVHFAYDLQPIVASPARADEYGQNVRCKNLALGVRETSESANNVSVWDGDEGEDGVDDGLEVRCIRCMAVQPCVEGENAKSSSKKYGK